ncbi:hypothetical protein NA57DRAFT_79172 [Rhizodiscina lignyota]|uniref:Uncharacterized protein n=1 Tax=Rhizodiscina lignyota TaxID=1504668 RepID=A0A9P4IBC5_9PEZI|nr:hypothetical protein NA57DRAFT_79172 [Rhizodiscina lignyota]
MNQPGLPSQAAIQAALQQQPDRYAEQVWKLSLRVFATTTSIAAIALAVIVVINWEDNDDILEDYTSEYYADDWTDAGAYTGLGFASLAIAWNVSEFITLCVRSVRRGGIHPGSHVALDLILWMGFLASGLTEILIDFWTGASLGLCGILYVDAILHFTLFVWACIDTRRRNELSRTQSLALAMQITEQQQLQARTSMIPQYGQASIPPNMVMVPVEEWQQMKQMAQVSQQQAPPYRQSAVSPVSGSPHNLVAQPAPVARPFSPSSGIQELPMSSGHSELPMSPSELQSSTTDSKTPL